MGIFNTRKTFVGTQVQRVIEDASLPNAIRDGSLKNLFDPEGEGDQLVENVLDQMVTSLGIRGGRMYRYGRDKYIFGLPQSTLHSSLSGKAATLAVIRSIAGPSASLEYYHYGPLNRLHTAWKSLVSAHGYDAVTNQIGRLSTEKGVPVYLEDMQVVVTNATLDEAANGSLDQWGTPANAGKVPTLGLLALPGLKLGKSTPYAVDPTAAGDYVRVDYCWEETVQTQVGTLQVPLKTIKHDSFTIPITDLNPDADYHQAKYVLTNGQVGYFTYLHGSGGQTSLDAVFDAANTDSSSFFPFGYLRFNKKSTVTDPTTDEYKSSKKLFDCINMDFDSVGHAINANPDIKDVEQAMLMMVVPAKTSNPMEQRYLFDFFSGIHTSSSGFANSSTNPGSFQVIQAQNKPAPLTSIIIQDKRFKMALSFQSIVKHRVAGSIGEPGTYASGVDKTLAQLDIPIAGGGTLHMIADTPRHWYRHQVTETIYEEVLVVDLKMKYWIFENYTTTGDGEKDILLVPLDVRIVETYSIPEREQLYARSLHYVFNSRVVVKLKWYQTDAFRFFMIAAAILITVITQGATLQAFLTALATGAITVEMVLIYITEFIIKQLITMYVTKLFVKAVGPKVAFIAATLAAIAGGFGAYGSGLPNIPVASALLTASTNLISAINRETAQQYDDLQSDAVQFEEYMTEQENKVQQAQALLDRSSIPDPMLILGESPNDFYHRTVHSGNIGTVGIDAITYYVDMALRLPKISDTLGA